MRALDDKPFEVKPNLWIAFVLHTFKIVFAVMLLLLIYYSTQKYYGVDYSIIYEFVNRTTLIDVIRYGILFIYAITTIIITLDLSSITYEFMSEGFEYSDGFFSKKKQILYSNILRVNYSTNYLYGKITLELSGTDVLKLELPYISYPGAAAARIKKRLDESISKDIFGRIKEADRSLEDDRVERMIGIVKSQRVTKDNVVSEFERILGGEKVSKNVFEIILSNLIKYGKLSKKDLSEVLLEMNKRELLSKKDIADVLFYLND